MVRFRGRDVRELDPLELRRRACLVPQLPAPLADSVAGDVSWGAALRGQGVDVEENLARAGLDRTLAGRRTDRLSVGEQQRVMLARALALEPEVLLLDEPTAALDEGARAEVERTLARLAGRGGSAMVLVTHERAQADRLASRVVGLDGGRVTG